MPESRASNDIDTIVEAIGLYDASRPVADPQARFLALAEVVRLASEHSLSLREGFDGVENEIGAIQAGLRASLGPVIGMLLGRIVPAFAREIDREIETHQGTIDRGEPDPDAASWNIGRLQHKKKTLETLFRRFVREGEDL